MKRAPAHTTLLQRSATWLLLAAAALAGGCATNTMTGRTQMSLVSDESVSRQSLSYYSAMVSEYDRKQKVIESGPVKERIDRITNRLIAQAVLYRPESAQWDWKVSVIDEPKTINAFCLPGGLMGIYTGFMQQLDATDDEIAQVMGHEIGHALAGHSAEKMSVQLMSNIAVLVLSAATAQNAQDMQNRHAALTVGALAFVNLPNSRTAETESDRIGIELAARAGYKPEAAVSLWQKMAAKSGGGSSFLSTHPGSDQRARDLGELQAPMQKLYAKAQTGTAPGTGHHPGHAHDWLHAPKASRPSVDPSQAIALYSPRWDAFENGRIELTGSNVPGFLLKQRGLKAMHDQQQWRDLASSVMDIDLQIDLSYHYLARAALGLGHEAAGLHYLQRAKELGAVEGKGCAGHLVIGCSGVEVGRK